MFLFFNLLSRSVHQEEQESELIKSDRSPGAAGECVSLTVWRKSLLTSCNGFTVIDSDGNIVYRVDNYIGRPEEVTLMDGYGKSLLTMHRRKRLAIVDSWLVYEGEVDDDNCKKTKLSRRPICCVKKSMSILQANSNILAYVYHGTSNKRCAYTVEGSYANRSCKVIDVAKRVVAEIRKKEAPIGGISFGIEVFLLIIQPGFDPRFAMALVLLLDQMFS